MSDGKTVGVALVGCGTVGGGVVRMLQEHAELLATRSGLRLKLRHVVDLDFTRARSLGVDEAILRKDLAPVLTDAETAIVIELAGGTTFAKTVFEQALAAGKHVVTANKALLAHHGRELWALARQHGVCIGFGASCVGGVPVIGALLNGLLVNDIEALYGIVNGTCNFILSSMVEQGASYDDVLAAAQADGLAEADPTLDVKGIDSAHKLTILAGLAFGHAIDLDTIHVEGIDDLRLIDVRYGQEVGYTVKLLAIAQRQAKGLSLRVHPAFIANDHPLARVSGPFNAVSVFGHATGHTMYYGRGAGSMPTASAVVADLVDVALGNAQRRFEQLGVWADVAPPANQLPIDQVRGRYYLRIMSQDSPGVLAEIAAALGRHRIGIASVLQHEADEETQNTVPVVITTHSAVEGDVQKARAEIDALDVVRAPAVMIRIVDEYPEPQV